ncbi:MAG: hypothetical protein GF344_09735 [Chitinivibrionales bacterium]|nr:hypothetical protein [Chitinivibrionales bacterium]MBD3357120.1 hypothetical protein [Chitinivibrionales bacterium]
MTFRTTASVIIVILSTLCLSSARDAQSQKEYYADKGVSEAEWGMILDARMPREKIDEVLKSGASISLYFTYPWLKVGYTEQQWLRLRREGLTLEEAPPCLNNHDADAEWAVVHAFLVPGLHHFKRRQYTKAWSMTGIAALALSGLSYGVLTKNGYALAASIGLWVPNALWSSIDIGAQVYRENNPEAARFSTAYDRSRRITLSLVVPIVQR